MSRGRRIGNIPLRKTMNGRRSWLGRSGEQTLNSMVLSLSNFRAWNQNLTSFVTLDDAHAARRRYKKDLDLIKPDLEAYNKQKAIALGQGSSSLTSFDASGSSSEVAAISQEQRLAAESLYRDANTLLYGDSKPSEDAIDRVVSKINQESVSSITPFFSLLIPFTCTVSTRRVNSLASASTKRKEILPISTNTTGCSTRR